MDNFKPIFDQVAVNGILGDPHGIPAYGYARVSSDDQAEEGRSGLPRQLEHIHEVALKKGLCITFDCMYFDDASGFDFQNRPGLTALRNEYRQPGRKANYIVFEHIDRLSRNADWHQGYLLDEMKQYGITPVFWREWTSRIERVVLGVVSQDAMEQAKQRLMQGNLFKAKSGRVTARTPAYGYMLVDADGKPSPRARKETYYAPHPEQAPIVRMIFEMVAQGYTIYAVAEYLNAHFPPPNRASIWHARWLHNLVRNPLYKGEFYAHRIKHIPTAVVAKGDLSGATKIVYKKAEHPREEWIKVDVPPIVPPELWELANRMLDKNKNTAIRNNRGRYLLTGLMRCASCGYSVNASGRRLRGYWMSAYICSTKHGRIKSDAKRVNCPQGQISTKIVDNAVWNAILDIILQPQYLERAIAELGVDKQRQELENQIQFLQSELEKTETEEKRLYNAYMAGAFDAEEYADKRQEIKARRKALTENLQNLRDKLNNMDVVEKERELILKMIQEAREAGILAEAPFDLKKRIIKTLVDKIIFNASERWAEIHGVFSTPIMVNLNRNAQIVGYPADRVSYNSTIGMTIKYTARLTLSQSRRVTAPDMFFTVQFVF